MFSSILLPHNLYRILLTLSLEVRGDYSEGKLNLAGLAFPVSQPATASQSVSQSEELRQTLAITFHYHRHLKPNSSQLGVGR